MQLPFGKKEAAKDGGKAQDRGAAKGKGTTSARGKGVVRSGAKDNADAAKGKRKRVESKVKSDEPSGMFSAPAQIMGPRLLFIAAIVILCVLGLVMIYSSSSIEAYGDSAFGNNPMYFFKQQVVWLAVGTVACVAATFIPYSFWKKRYVALVLWFVTAVLLLAVVAGLGSTSLGADRALRFGPISIQPAEFAKISVILLIACILERWNANEISGTLAAGEISVVTGLTLLLIFKQPDLGTSMILLIGILAMFMLANVPRKIILGIVGFVVGFFIFTSIVQPYHLDRIWTMLDPWADAQGNGYQTVQGFLAFGSGGIFGTGLGMSRQKYDYLPYAYNDFIYAVIGEELGLIGALATLLLFVVFIYAGMRISHTAKDTFGGILSGALTCMVGFQACLNMACVVGVAPVTGKALPFISYGGSSLLATMIMCGLVLSVSLRSRLDNQVEKRRENLVVMDGGKAARRTGQQDLAQAGRQPGALDRVGGLVGGIAGTIGSAAGNMTSHLPGAKDAGSGKNLQERRADQSTRRKSSDAGRLSSERGRSSSGYSARKSETSSSAHASFDHERAAYGNAHRARSRQQSSDSDLGYGARHNSGSRKTRAAYGGTLASEERRERSATTGTRRSRQRKGDLDIELVDIVPKSARSSRREPTRTGRSSSASHGGTSRSGRSRSNGSRHGGNDPRAPRR